MLGDKPGILHCHVGNGKRKLDMVFRVINETEIPPSQIIPTHCNRNPDLLEEAIRFNKSGGFIDFTAELDPEQTDTGLISIDHALQTCLEKKASLDRITVSSDSNGSMPVFNKQGNLIGLTIANQESLLNNLRYLINKNRLDIENALKFFTQNPATGYKLKKKGRLSPGFDADINVFDSQFNLIYLFSLGKKMIENKKLIAKSTFL
jgi:beta-aspartyl-dipeptidase (metallo-type)